jgi:serine protein kinase
MARIVTKSKTRDEDQVKKYSEMVEVMINDYGYSAESAEATLAYASNNLWRDS